MNRLVCRGEMICMIPHVGKRKVMTRTGLSLFQVLGMDYWNESSYQIVVELQQRALHISL